MRAYDAKRQMSGLDEVERREFELSDARWDAEDAVLNAQPHSPAGFRPDRVYGRIYCRGHEDR
jgi:hypothetical protein